MVAYGVECGLEFEGGNNFSSLANPFIEVINPTLVYDFLLGFVPNYHLRCYGNLPFFCQCIGILTGAGERNLVFFYKSGEALFGGERIGEVAYKPDAIVCILKVNSTHFSAIGLGYFTIFQQKKADGEGVTWWQTCP
jgi:hypothetical protein